MSSGKYDRQLRLWGSIGQEKLAESHICVIGSDSTACEVLKNLVLPGIGQFTIVDDKVVTQTDAETNFFVSKDSVGNIRAKEVCTNLEELNPDVKGYWLTESPQDIFSVKSKVVDITKFDIVVVSNMSEKRLTTTAMKEHLGKTRSPILLCRSVGLLACLKSFFTERCIIQSNPDPVPREDLHLYAPFDGLLNFTRQLIQNSDKAALKQIPYLAILVETMAAYKKQRINTIQSLESKRQKIDSQRDEQRLSAFLQTLGLYENTSNFALFANPPYMEEHIPMSYSEKREFKTMVVKFFEERDIADSDTFSEAKSNAYTAYTQRKSVELASILDASETINLNESTAHIEFWVMVKALKLFLLSPYGSHLLPLSGKLPDMSSATVIYTELQQLFRAKYETDIVIFTALTEKVLAQHNLTINLNENIRLFINNVSNLRIVQGIFANTSTPVDFSKNMIAYADVSSDNQELFKLFDHFLIRQIMIATDSAENVSPADISECLLKRLKLYQQISKKESATQRLDFLIKSDEIRLRLVEEFLRGLNMTERKPIELNTITSIIGAVTALEVIKLLTQQFEPLNNTFIFNGYTSTGKELQEPFISFQNGVSSQDGANSS